MLLILEVWLWFSKKQTEKITMGDVARQLVSYIIKSLQLISRLGICRSVDEIYGCPILKELQCIDLPPWLCHITGHQVTRPPGGVLTIFWVTGRLGPFDPPFSTYVEFWPLLLGSDVEYWPPFFKHCRILTPIFQHVEFWPPFSDL